MSEPSLPQLLSDVVAGLTRAGQKELPCRYLYDDLGSCLFEAITYLPEYGLTRADERLLQRHSAALANLCSPSPLVAELGSGGGRKTRLILEALRTAAGHSPPPAKDAQLPKMVYSPIDISAVALAQCEKELSPYATVLPIQSSYLDGISQASQRRADGQQLLVLFLGSTIGNFNHGDAQSFLYDLRDKLLPGDMLLLGADLQKPEATMLLAYNDPTGVTAAFNLNLLGRINRSLDANFDLRQFRHEARWVATERCIEMHLVAGTAQTVRIGAADLTVEFAAGESIFTESSHKYQASEVVAMVTRAGFECSAQWVDESWPFMEAVCIAASRDGATERGQSGAST